ncbi:MAG TPA: FliH/SctL family protein [Methylomusa anaerophila]|uniref:Yop proteins translocation protein L n=1 Tax=Methylomusa anaerophila TaxID=1930071 RepID=A0A348AQ39_9FIRM|nr:FliH/SctL family protein [Methylomusa anaerophila]BBB93187.1 Yop proteins translocation protein L [Methylomusa anaerophila]HML86981.1 FliH/SctL family protein [Methylomusa anaerophila]
MSNLFKIVSVNHTPVIIESIVFPEQGPENDSEPEPKLEPEFDYAAAREEMELCINEAKIEAQRIVAAAEEKAQHLMDETQIQAEAIKQQAYKESYDLGKQEGYENGNLEAREEMKQAIHTAAEKAQKIISTAEQEAVNMITDAERKIIDMAVAIARKIVARELEENPTAILPIVKEALNKVRDQESVTVRVNPEDFEMVLMAKGDLQMMMGNEQAVSIVSDQTVAAGGCVVDTAFGTVDARLDTKFEMIHKAIQDVSP